MAKKIDINQQELKILMEPIKQNDPKYIRCKVLIVCEGEKTEPLYFKSFHMMKNSSSLVFDVSSMGLGCNPEQVVSKAIELKKAAEEQRKPYDSVWAVFDKDAFTPCDFNRAIERAERNEIGCAWSNEAFELWYVYHFENRSTKMSRSEYQKAITQRVQKHGNGKKAYTYQKNNSQMRRILRDCGCNEKKAIKLAEKQANTFVDRKFHCHNPCTMVYKLVKQLIGEDKEFVRLINDKLGEK